MSTPGLVSIMSNGVVQIKAICLCNGVHWKELTKKVRQEKPRTAQETFELAREVDFGCPRCLVVVGPDKMATGEGCQEVPYHYWVTYHYPDYHPGYPVVTSPRTNRPGGITAGRNTAVVELN